MSDRRIGHAISVVLLLCVCGPALAGGPLSARARISAVQPLRIDGLHAAVQVKTDVDGIPHILANNEHDMVMVQGFIHARDRLFQMDLTRRQASGTLAEVVGPSELGSDVELRTIGLRRAAERSLAALSDETRVLLEAYSDGVNAYVATHPLPLEYGLLELTTFEPWTPVDSLVIAKAIAFSLSFDLDISLTQTLVAYQTAGSALGFDGTALFFEDLIRSAPFDPASTVPDASMAPTSANGSVSGRVAVEAATSAGALPGGLSPATIRLASEYADQVRDLPLFEGSLEPGRRTKGSNEWGVSGEHTNSGTPLMANDPHLALDTPSTFYQVHLVADRDRIDVIGSGFPGVPFVILGQNQRITWGATTNPMDVTDTYQEVIVPDPASPSGLSTMYMGEPEPIIPLPQVFRFNQIGDGIPDNLAVAPPGGGIPEFVLIVPRRNEGPLVAVDLAAGFGLSVQYTGFSATREVEAFRLWDRARNLGEFIEGLQLFDFGSQNWSYADLDGNLAYFSSAEMPLREDLQDGTVDGLPPYFIRDGAGGNEWLPVSEPQPGQAVPYEVLPFDEMPQIVNPPAGYFVNANNDPAGTTLDNNPLNQLRPGGGIYYLSPGYAIACRAGRITREVQQRIAAGPVSADDMAEIQSNVALLDAEVLTPYILQAYANATEPGADPILAALAADARVAEAVGRLEGWDYSTPTGILEGYDASDVDGELSPPDAEEVAASIAATIYSVWRGQMIGNTIDAVVDAIGIPRPGNAQAMTALRNLLDSFDVMHGVGASGLDFFNVSASSREAARDIVILQSLADALELLAGPAFDEAFAGSTDQDDYRWGLLHRIVLNHPLGGPFDIPPAGGAFPPPLPGLAGIPVDGGFLAVDASSHSARADSSNEFMFGGGPVRRYVGQPVRAPWRIEGRSSLPGGESGDLASPFYTNLLGRWLTNESYPLRQRLQDINRALYRHEVFTPGRPVN